jgi:hypothetical protein
MAMTHGEKKENMNWTFNKRKGKRTTIVWVVGVWVKQKFYKEELVEIRNWAT